MKKLIITVALMFCIVDLQAQLVPFPDPGMSQGTLRYGDWTNPYIINYSFQYSKDTIINDSLFHFFQVENSFSRKLVYYDSGKVYESANWNYDHKTLIYDFSLELNDTFIGKGVTFQPIELVVSMVSTITLTNGETRKYLELSDGVNEFNTRRWVDGIGDIDYGLFRWADFEGGYTELVCHRGDSGLIHLGGNFNEMFCDSMTNVFLVGLDEIAEISEIEVVPNPVVDQVEVSFRNWNGDCFSVELINSMSQVVKSEKINNRKSIAIDLSDLSSGIYYVRVSNGIEFRIEKVFKL